MGLETGNYIDNLDRDWPLSSDSVSEGDNHLQLIKRALQYTFPLGTDTSATSDVGPDQAVQVLSLKLTPDQLLIQVQVVTLLEQWVCYG